MSEVAVTAPIGGCCHCAAPAPQAKPKSARSEAMIWLRLAIALVLAGQSMMFNLGLNTSEEKPTPGSFEFWLVHGGLIAAALAVIALLGPALFRAQWQAIRQRKVTVEGLFILSLLGAFIGSLVSTLSGEGSVYYEVVSIVLVVYTFGKLAGARSRRKALEAAEALREQYSHAWVDTENGRQRIPVDELCTTSSRVSVNPGEPVTVDGVILSGEGFVSETSLTGEPTPVVRRAGDRVLAGSHSVDASFTIRPEKLTGERQIDAILERVEAVRQEQPSNLQAQADSIIRWFLPVVATVSLITFVVWVNLLPAGLWWKALFNSMAVLLVACPCALGLATPIAVWGGLQRLSQLGIVAQNGRIIDRLASATTIVFDKTGTLSEDSLALVDFVASDSQDRAWLLSAVASVEEGLSHPIARALEAQSHNRLTATDRRLVPGQGVRAVVDGREVLIGDIALAPQLSSAFEQLVKRSPAHGQVAKKIVYVIVDGQAAGVALLDERLRDGVDAAFDQIAAAGGRLMILTGDPEPRWKEIRNVEVRSGLSPEDKVREVEQLVERGEQVIFVGDGVNDASAMAVAHGAIAMQNGAGLTRSTADATLTGKSLASLPQAIATARKVRSGVRGIMLFALVYNGIGMTVAALGLLHPVFAALLMVGSSSIVSFRAIRSAGVQG